MPSSRSRRAELERLGAQPFAHRGLHGPGRPENSRAAFRAAIEAGSGMELDVQASRDGAAIVFHDYDLDRLTATQGRVADLDAHALTALRLCGISETIPLLADVLDLIGGRAPLLIEVKSPNRHVVPLCRAVAAALGDYPGPVGVMSFNPEVGAWFARHTPERLRGLVVTESGKKNVRGRVERRLSFWRAQADFLAYDIRDLPSAFAAGKRAAGVPVYTWTVRTAADRARAAAEADQIIYEDVPGG
ncbi:MAG TPA: glycerophosphodiester phosphodiesterase family protein [Allosphingosinicella sp.]|jgi:glycerophosphoryl diester phosphodiesterase|nr:glycerophosphodiester phosphodiesterase family protein [Allosphingosinicella sp.]